LILFAGHPKTGKGEEKMTEVQAEGKIKGAVRQRYGDIARQFVEGPGEEVSRATCCDAAETAEESSASRACCGSSGEPVEASGAARFYSAEELDDLPDTVTGASLGCGNPLAIADLRPGEVVLDLGSGGGIDCFLAAKKVGAEGKVIGLDMTPDMIKLARRNAKKLDAHNVDFRYGEMEDMPLPGESVDVVISNCVINLSPDKDAVFGEAFRVLRPGGRLSVSDIVVDGELPEPIRQNLNAWAGCIAGALDESDYLDKIRAAGFQNIQVLSRDYADLGETAEWEQVEATIVQEDGTVLGEKDTQAFLDGAGLSPQDLAHKVASIKVKAYRRA
jgi:SAM-dependent methyltransferase